jgi:hypothetical protein
VEAAHPFAMASHPFAGTATFAVEAAMEAAGAGSEKFAQAMAAAHARAFAEIRAQARFVAVFMIVAMFMAAAETAMMVVKLLHLYLRYIFFSVTLRCKFVAALREFRERSASGLCSG